MLADLTRLFDACFRIQREASLAAGRHIPLVVENVRGAIPWVGRSRWNFGSLSPLGRRAGADASDGGVQVQRNELVRPHRSDGQDFTRIAGRQAAEGIKHHGSGADWSTGPASLPSASPRRKAASAMIARIPLPLSRHIAAVYRPSSAWKG